MDVRAPMREAAPHGNRVHGPGERVAITSAGCSIEVDRVYADVFDPELRAAIEG